MSYSTLKTVTVAICLVIGAFLASCTSTRTSTPEQVLQTTVEPSGTQLLTSNIVHAPNSSEAAGSLGVIVDPTMTIVDVVHFSPAQRNAIKVGDVLVSFDGIPYATESEKIIAILSQELASQEKKHEVVVLRKGKEKRFKLHLNIPDKFISPLEPPTPMPLDTELKLY